VDDYVIQMRWADIDQLNHVNNVRYLDYADEARLALIESGQLPDDCQIGRCEVEFLRPLLLSMEPVKISGIVEENRLIQEIFTGEGTVFARVTSDLAESRSPIAPSDIDAGSYPFQLRRGDATDGFVGNANHFGIFQEARIRTVSKLIGISSAGGFVVGRVAIDYSVDLPWRKEPYTVRTWLEKFGRSSIELCSEIFDQGTVFARATAVLVGFDLESQRSRPLNDEERAHLEETLRNQQSRTNSF